MLPSEDAERRAVPARAFTSGGADVVDARRQAAARAAEVPIG
jgi:hypothetical protein